MYTRNPTFKTIFLGKSKNEIDKKEFYVDFI